nr:MAG TPA: replisome organizer protein [Caudoviricetes sp.]
MGYDTSYFRVFIVTYILSISSYTWVLYWITKKPPRQTASEAIPERKIRNRKDVPVNIIHHFDYQHSFTMVPNQILRDSRLSWGARGLMSFIVSQKPGHSLSRQELIDASPMGRMGVKSLIDELQELGYLEISQSREGGKFGSSIMVAKLPGVSHSEPLSGLPIAVEPSTVSLHTPLNTKVINNTNLPPIVPHGDDVACATETLRAGALTDYDELGTESILKIKPDTRQHWRKADEVVRTSNANAPQKPQNAPLSDFETFWALVPRRVGKKAAERAWRAVERRGESQDAIDGMRAYAAAFAQRGAELKYVPHPSTWLNRRGWEDDLEAVFPSQKPRMTEWEQKAAQMGYDLSTLKNTPQIAAQRFEENRKEINQWN